MISFFIFNFIDFIINLAFYNEYVPPKDNEDKQPLNNENKQSSNDDDKQSSNNEHNQSNNEYNQLNNEHNQLNNGNKAFLFPELIIHKIALYCQPHIIKQLFYIESYRKHVLNNNCIRDQLFQTFRQDLKYLSSKQAIISFLQHDRELPVLKYLFKRFDIKTIDDFNQSMSNYVSFNSIIKRNVINGQLNMLKYLMICFGPNIINDAFKYTELGAKYDACYTNTNEAYSFIKYYHKVKNYKDTFFYDIGYLKYD